MSASHNAATLPDHPAGIVSRAYDQTDCALTRTKLARLLCVVALVLSLSACGNASTGGAQSAGTTAAGLATTATTAPTTTGTTTPATTATGGPGLSRGELDARAGAICSAATAEGNRLKAPSDMTSNARAAAAYFDRAVPALDAETRALQALRPAAALSGEWEAVLGAQVALDSLADGYRQKAHAGRETSLAEIGQLSTVGETIARAAIRLGVHCD